MTRLQKAKTLLVVGVALSVIGGLTNVSIGLLHIMGIDTPINWLIGVYFPYANYFFVNGIIPFSIGASGCIVALASLGFLGRITSNPEQTRTLLLILGSFASIGTWVVGGVIIMAAGIFTHYHWVEVSEARIIRRSVSIRGTDLPAESGLPQQFCRQCGAAVSPDERYCASCGRRI